MPGKSGIISRFAGADFASCCALHFVYSTPIFRPLMSVLINILLAIHILVSLLIVLVVLMQRPKNEGLGAAFGGGMTENLFGAQTTNVLANFTRWLGGIFFVLTLLLSVLYVRQSKGTNNLTKRLSTAPAAATPASATPAPAADGAALP